VRVAPTTVNVTEPVFPWAVVILRLWPPSDAVVEMLKVAVTSVELRTLIEFAGTVMPVPVCSWIPSPLLGKFVPSSVTVTSVPRSPELGEIDVNVGGCGAVTENVTLPVVPPGVVTLTFRPLIVAFVEIANNAVIVVELCTTTLLTVTPGPDTAIVAGPLKFVPVSVTATLLP